MSDRCVTFVGFWSFKIETPPYFFVGGRGQCSCSGFQAGFLERRVRILLFLVLGLFWGVLGWRARVGMLGRLVFGGAGSGGCEVDVACGRLWVSSGVVSCFESPRFRLR
jgi:hypothetical protein